MPSTKFTSKEVAQRILDDQPDDVTLDELIRELLFHRMIEEGIADADAGRTISHEQLKQEIDSWFRSSGP